MHELLLLLQPIAAQVEAVADTVGSAYEKNVFVGTIILLAFAVVVLFLTLNKSYKDRATEMKAAHDEHNAAMAAKSAQITAEFKEKDEKLYTLLERVTEALAQNSNKVNALTEEIRRSR
jgi:cell division septation protein DedD